MYKIFIPHEKLSIVTEEKYEFVLRFIDEINKLENDSYYVEIRMIDKEDVLNV